MINLPKLQKLGESSDNSKKYISLPSVQTLTAQEPVAIKQPGLGEEISTGIATTVGSAIGGTIKSTKEFIDKPIETIKSIPSDISNEYSQTYRNFIMNVGKVSEDLRNPQRSRGEKFLSGVDALKNIIDTTFAVHPITPAFETAKKIPGFNIISEGVGAILGIGSSVVGPVFKNIANRLPISDPILKERVVTTAEEWGQLIGMMTIGAKGLNKGESIIKRMSGRDINYNLAKSKSPAEVDKILEQNKISKNDRLKLNDSLVKSNTAKEVQTILSEYTKTKAMGLVDEIKSSPEIKREILLLEAPKIELPAPGILEGQAKLRALERAPITDPIIDGPKYKPEPREIIGVNNKKFEVSPEKYEQYLDIKKKYDIQVERLNKIIEDEKSSASAIEQATKQLKAEGFKFSTEKRKLTGDLTPREISNAVDYERSNYIGKKVMVKDKGMSVEGYIASKPSFGRFKVKLYNGNIVTMLANEIKEPRTYNQIVKQIKGDAKEYIPKLEKSISLPKIFKKEEVVKPKEEIVEAKKEKIDTVKLEQETVKEVSKDTKETIDKIEEQIFKKSPDLNDFERQQNKEQIKQISAMDINHVKDVTMGKVMPDGNIPRTAYLAVLENMANDMANKGDFRLAEELSLSNAGRSAGQELQALNIAAKDNIVDIIRDIRIGIEERLPKSTRENKGKELKDISDKIRETIKEVSKEKPTRDMIVEALERIKCK